MSKLAIHRIVYYALLFLIPVQLGRHFWPNSSTVMGLRIDYLSPTVYVHDLIILFLFFLWIYKDSKNLRSLIQEKAALLITIIVYLLIGVITSAHIENGLLFFVRFLEFLFVGYFTAYKMPSKEFMGHVAVAFMGGIIFESLIIFMQYFHQSSVGGLLYWFGERTFNGQTPGIANTSIDGRLILRPYGTFPHPNVLGGYMVIGLTILLWRKYTKLILATVITGSIGLFFTMSRSAIIIWALVLIGYVFLRKTDVLRRYVVGGIFILFLIVGFLSFAGERLYKFQIHDESVVLRTSLIENALSMIKENPFLGVGFGNYLPSLPFFQKAHAFSTLQPVHNIFLFIAAETGLVGLFFVMYFLYKTYKNLLKHPEKSNNLLKKFLFFIVILIGLFDHYLLTLQQGQLLLAFVLGLCWQPESKKK